MQLFCRWFMSPNSSEIHFLPKLFSNWSLQFGERIPFKRISNFFKSVRQFALSNQNIIQIGKTIVRKEWQTCQCA